MRKGFRSSRGAMRGTIGGAAGFATVAISVSPFDERDSCRHEPFAARRCALTYLFLQDSEQKCSVEPDSHNGSEISSDTCVPHTGSRCKRRAAMDGPTLGFELGEKLRIAQAMMRRRSATPQDKMSSQNKNRAKRARRVIRSLFVCVDRSSSIPHRPRCAKCMQGEKGVSNENV